MLKFRALGVGLRAWASGLMAQDFSKVVCGKISDLCGCLCNHAGSGGDETGRREQ